MESDGLRYGRLSHPEQFPSDIQSGQEQGAGDGADVSATEESDRDGYAETTGGGRMTTVIACIFGIAIGLLAGFATAGSMLEKEYDDREDKEMIRQMRRIAEATEKMAEKY